MYSIYDPMFDKGWIKFNEEKWGLESEPVKLEQRKKGGWEFETILYKNNKGEIVLPPRNPYIPVRFECVSSKLSIINRAKRAAIERLIENHILSRIKSSIKLSPVINDVRPFLWRNMLATPCYTYHIDFENFKGNHSPNVLTKANKARRLGYYCEISKDFDEVQKCLCEPEKRKGFNYLVDSKDLKKINTLMGDDKFCAIVCKNKRGEIKGASVLVYQVNGYVLGWSAGIMSDALRDGVNSLMHEYTFNYFSDKKCKVFDFLGANIPPVAKMKEAWGGELVTYYEITKKSPIHLAKEGVSVFKGLFPQLG